MVIGLLHYATFSNLIDDFNSIAFGYYKRITVEREIRRFYTKEQEAEYGILGIKVKVILVCD